MTIRAVVDFWRKVQTSPELQAQLAEAGDDGSAPIARQAGFDVTPQEMHDVDRVVAFWDRVEHDEGLRRQLGPAHECDTAEAAMREISKVARGAGFELPLEALQVVTGALVSSGAASAGSGNLSDDQLDAVAGGAAPVPGQGNAALDRARRGIWLDPRKIGPGPVGAKP